MRGGRKGSYFFVIDAFVASSIFVITIMVVLGLGISNRPPEQSYAYASDYLEFLTATEIRDFTADAVENLTLNGNITDSRLTIAEQILQFHNRSRDDLARFLINDTVDNLPAIVSVNISILELDGRTTTFYARGLQNADEKGTHLAVSQVEYTMINGTMLYGPVVFKVEVWS